MMEKMKHYKNPSSMIWKDLKSGTSRRQKMRENDAMGFKAFRMGTSMRKSKRKLKSIY